LGTRAIAVPPVGYRRRRFRLRFTAPSEAALCVRAIGEAARLEIGPRGFKSRKVKMTTNP
jgi:hypothetical protein